MDEHIGQPGLPPPVEWLDTLARSRADVAAGRVVSGDALKRRLQETLAEMLATNEIVRRH